MHCIDFTNLIFFFIFQDQEFNVPRNNLLFPSLQKAGIYRCRLDSAFFVESKAAFFFFFFPSLHAFQWTTSTVAALFITLYALKNIKNGS